MGSVPFGVDRTLSLRIPQVGKRGKRKGFDKALVPWSQGEKFHKDRLIIRLYKEGVNKIGSCPSGWTSCQMFPT